MSFCATKEVKARKAHRCHWCSQDIQKGEQHIVISGAGEDGMFRTRLHIECNVATNAIPAQEWEDYDAVWGVGARGHRHETNWGEDEGCPGCKAGLPQGRRD